MTLRFVPIYLRNLLVWRKLAVASVLGNIADPLIMLVAFGYGLGQLIRQIEGVDYIVFLAAGSLCMSTMMAASFEALYSAFSRMHVQRTWESLLNAPLELRDVVLAEWLWAGSKSLFSAVSILLVVLVLGISRSAWLLWVLPITALLGLCFAAIGLCFNAIARGYDFFTYYFTLVLTPMTFLSGVYYPLSGLPDWLASIARFLPLAAAVDLVRPLVLGRAPDNVVANLGILVGTTVAAYALADWLTHRRFRQ